MRILVTNDDGIRAPGLEILANWARKLGEVTVIAPKFEQSAKSHSIMESPNPITMATGVIFAAAAALASIFVISIFVIRTNSTRSSTLTATSAAARKREKSQEFFLVCRKAAYSS